MVDQAETWLYLTLTYQLVLRYATENEKSLYGFHRFELPQKGATLPAGVDNMRNARIDSAFVISESPMILQMLIENCCKYEIEIKFLHCDNPKSRRKYPYMTTLLACQELPSSTKTSRER